LRPVFIIENDHEILHREVEIVTYDEGMEIATHILENVMPTYECVGVAANQIGIMKAVAVVHVGGRDPIFLLNPKLTGLTELMKHWKEGCLSFPGDRITVPRFKTISYQNLTGLDKITDQVGFHSDFDHLLETVAIQHEIDHLGGITIYDRQRKPIRSQDLPKRNDLCPCGSGKKYKRCCLK
jgi:peptide deformylase